MFKVVVDTETNGKNTLIRKLKDKEKAIAYKYLLEELVQKLNLECYGEVRIIGSHK